MRLLSMLAIAMICPLLAHAQSQEDPWLAIENGWIWEVVDQTGDLAGRWNLADGVLQDDVTYQMTFSVTDVEGTIALYLGDAQRFLIDAPGTYSYDFTANDRKRMMFSAIGLENGRATLAANSIRVGIKGAGLEPSNPDPWLAQNDGWIWKPTSTLELLGGSWWNESLLPGRTYRISFNATDIAGGVGLLLGVALALNISDLMLAAEEAFGFRLLAGTYFDRLPSVLMLSDLLWIGTLALLLALGGALYPALRAGRVDPAPALHGL
jgi:hypothetical protein